MTVDELRKVMRALKSDMRATIEKTVKDGKEYGFVICNENGKIFKGPECHGDSCHIFDSTIKNCPTVSFFLSLDDGSLGFSGDKSPPFGLFHTHPVGPIEFGILMSPEDFVAGRFNKINCIGSASGNERKARCYDMDMLSNSWRGASVNPMSSPGAPNVAHGSWEEWLLLPGEDFMNFQHDFVKKGRGVLTEVV